VAAYFVPFGSPQQAHSPGIFQQQQQVALSGLMLPHLQ
jgi:hypothetical protein